ncbi:ABC transporter ATP-binding protein [Rothia nasimurium]|uniref:ABC transporter ATP-binding protein n=1 Tax=Rothia nasimurium TaxID=85336 RepID=UPI002DD67ABB|nr:ATP-binding cassette domain-containing protein [Rothia nasimurium]
MKNFVEVSNISKHFGGRTVLNGVSLQVPEGSSLAIIGRSGSGKSTLLNIIGLLESADSGSLRLGGEAAPGVHSRKAMLLRRNTINYLFQSFALIPSQTVMQNILLGMEYVSQPKSEKNKRIMETLQQLSVEHLAHQKVATLSGGEQQRVAMARCLLKPGNLILADEPTGSLDRELAMVAMTEMLHLHRAYGKTLVVVTHDPEVAHMCDQIFELKV